MFSSKAIINNRVPATGIVQKSAANSFFLRCHHNSQLAEKLFDSNPRYNGIAVTVLQVLLIEQGYMLVECAFLEKEERGHHA